MNIKKFANDIANIHDTRNPFHIAAENDIHILYEELGKNLGYFSNLFRIKTIRINDHADPFLQPVIRKRIFIIWRVHSVFHINWFILNPFLTEHVIYKGG